MVLPPDPLIVDLGCGSSTLSIDLLLSLGGVDSGLVILIDFNPTSTPTFSDSRVSYLNADLLKPIELPECDNLCLIDKSTMDYILTLGPEAVTSYLTNNVLGRDAVYYCVSYHDEAFLGCIFSNLFESVEMVEVEREDGADAAAHKEKDVADDDNEAYDVNGNFAPNSKYVKKCYLYKCCGSGRGLWKNEEIEERIKQHLDEFYMEKNTMISEERVEELRRLFEGGRLKLEDVWKRVFDEGLKSVYGLEDFTGEVEEWKGEKVDGLRVEEVVEFLKVMQ
ncbi:hypothetical protein TrST_g10550 [Triparma strigata]|uniref:Methyltransferase domain-containing protein n=1 Tax=Triparma strigata TaxID=1606541 RepID=A0A9W7AZK7_9STRA|nr:hypothetical protein TrST_g10550 [Triparma strigata]